MSHQTQHCTHARNLNRAPLTAPVQPGKFGQMFPGLPALRVDLAKLDTLGKAMLQPGPEPVDNRNVPAGYTFLGQFIDHDITFDPTSLREVAVDPYALTNFRTPMLSLDHLYGRGPLVDQMLYQRTSKELFQLGLNGQPANPNPALAPGTRSFDTPRNPYSNFAIAGDPRNDENLIVSQLHVAMMLFHNKVVEYVRKKALPAVLDSQQLFEAAQKVVLHHYQWVVLNDYLPRILHADVWRQVRSQGSSLYRGPGEPFIPVEFSVAAFRFGHSTIRDHYNHNQFFRQGSPFGAATLNDLFDFAGAGAGSNAPPQVPVPVDWIVDWKRYFDFGDGGEVNPSRTIGPNLATVLGALTGLSNPTNLAVRNLQRGNMLGLPSGQCVARYYDYPALAPEAIDGLPETPLWYYVLKEARLEQDGRLGPVGSRICAEVFLGLLERAKSPVLEKGWHPDAALCRKPGVFEMPDLLTFAQFVNPLG